MVAKFNTDTTASIPSLHNGLYRFLANENYSRTMADIDEHNPEEDIIEEQQNVANGPEDQDAAAGAAMSVAIRNALMTKSVPDVPPYTAFFGKPIDVSHHRVPLCDAYPYVERENRTGSGGTDLDERRTRMVLVGYDEDSRTYKLYDPTNDRIYSRRYADVIFDENPKMQCSTPTFKTATPLDVQLFHTEPNDELA